MGLRHRCGAGAAAGPIVATFDSVTREATWIASNDPRAWKSVRPCGTLLAAPGRLPTPSTASPTR